MKKKAISRRAMLRGLCGGSAVMVGLPMLEAMLDSHGEAFADGSPIPIRMITWCFGNGILLNKWVPGGIRAPVTGADWPLSPELEPLANVKDYVTVLTGFHNKCKYQITHHEGMTVFNGYTMADLGEGPGFFSNARGPTIDQIYANAIDAGTNKPAIVRGIHTGVVSEISQADFGTTMHNVSHADHLNPNPPIKNAQSIYQQFVDLFVPADDPSKPTRLSVIDAVRADAAELKKRLGAKDIERLDGHLSGLADLETKINAIKPACDLPEKPTVTTDVVNGIEPVHQAISDLFAFAFACDATRIGSVLFAGGASEAPLMPGLSSQQGLSHWVYANALPYGGESWKPDGPGAPPYEESGMIADYHTGIVFTIKQLAYLLEKLQATPDTWANGKNLLDNSVVYVSSDCSDGWSHDIRDMPILVCGRAGGALESGLHIRDSNQRNSSDVLLSVLQAVVPEATEVGSLSYTLDGGYDPAYSNTPLSELKA